MPVIHEGEERQGDIQGTFARLRMEVKTDACWEEENAQSYECEIRPSSGAKRQCTEHDKHGCD